MSRPRRGRFAALTKKKRMFFLEGVAEVAEEAIATARRLHVIVGESRDRLLARDDATVFSLRLFELLPEHPILTVTRAVELLDCSRPAASKAVRILEAGGILPRSTSARRTGSSCSRTTWLTCGRGRNSAYEHTWRGRGACPW